MTDRKNSASTRRFFVRGSAAALAAGSVFSRSSSAMAQDGASTPAPGTNATAAPSTSGQMIVNVRDFGAAGDIATDDTAAIQAAINSLGAGGGVVFFPKGDYSITSALTVSSFTELLGESLSARILARTGDAAIRVASSDVFNSDVYIRRLNIINDGETPIGVDARYMSGCVIQETAIDNFSQYGITYGGETHLTNASWSNKVVGSMIRQCPTCIHLDGRHSEGGSPANWMTIEHCLIIPTNSADSIGVDLVNGDTVRLVNNDIGYASKATGVAIRKHLYAQLEYNRFEDIGEVSPSHPIEKEYGFSSFQITGVNVTIYQFEDLDTSVHYQRADFLEFGGEPTGGTFTLTRGETTTGEIEFSTDGETLATNVMAALESLDGIGEGNVSVTAASEAAVRIAWFNGRGRADRPDLTADASGLTGGDQATIQVVKGSTADAIRQARDIALTGIVNDTESPHLEILGEHLDLGIPVVTRQPVLSVRTPGSSGFQLQREMENFPRMELSVDGRIGWIDHETGQSIGGLKLLSSNLENPKVGWDDNLNVALPRRTTDEGDEAVGEVHRGSLHRYEGESGERDRLRIGVRDKDDSTYLRHLYAGFPASQDLEFPSIPTGSVAGVTMIANGARVGDAVMVIPPSNLAVGFTAFGFVSEENTVTIRVLNGSGEERQPDVATWSILVLQP